MLKLHSFCWKVTFTGIRLFNCHFKWQCYKSEAYRCESCWEFFRVIQGSAQEECGWGHFREGLLIPVCRNICGSALVSSAKAEICQTWSTQSYTLVCTATPTQPLVVSKQPHPSTSFPQAKHTKACHSKVSHVPCTVSHFIQMFYPCFPLSFDLSFSSPSSGGEGSLELFANAEDAEEVTHIQCDAYKGFSAGTSQGFSAVLPTVQLWT